MAGSRQRRATLVNETVADGVTSTVADLLHHTGAVVVFDQGDSTSGLLEVSADAATWVAYAAAYTADAAVPIYPCPRFARVTVTGGATAIVQIEGVKEIG